MVARNRQARQNWSKRAEGGLEERREKGKNSPVSSHLFVLAPVSLRCERIISTDQKGTACSLNMKK